ncbi:MAG TPA: hypothetical protein VEW28_10985 [Candidatus Kapabacteria bacterium]|nr:hypothetical protein [Candidatus Kapabacteria bacterium]
MVFKAALLGKELSHSISGILHEELFKIIAPKFGITDSTLEYTLIECPNVGQFISRTQLLNEQNYIGINVTYPYKSKLLKISEKKTANVEMLNSGNVARYIKGELESADTDGIGFTSALVREYRGFDLSSYHLIFVGDGAAAKAVAYALCAVKMPKSLTIVSRNQANALTLAEFCGRVISGLNVHVMRIPDAGNMLSAYSHRFIIQATPVGQKNHPGNPLEEFEWNESDIAADLIYNPPQTEFLAGAVRGGSKIMNGLGMLIEQAAFSQAFWLSGILPERSPLTSSEYRSMKTFCTKFVK